VWFSLLVWKYSFSASGLTITLSEDFSWRFFAMVAAAV
jgi:hypothetical protein